MNQSQSILLARAQSNWREKFFDDETRGQLFKALKALHKIVYFFQSCKTEKELRYLIQSL